MLCEARAKQLNDTVCVIRLAKITTRAVKFKSHHEKYRLDNKPFVLPRYFFGKELKTDPSTGC